MTLICLYVCVVKRYAHVAVIYPGEEAFEVTCRCVCTISMAASGNDSRTQTTTQQIAKQYGTLYIVYRIKSNCFE